ncbi:hypothetical protein [Treponema berlinense]|uniref:hypothetical protein n=1 Tax=Treponema berlinense TaxID=225004 RepID=UPI003FD7D55F
MNSSLKKSFCAVFFFLSFFCSNCLYAQVLSAGEANRKTALRYLKVAEQYAASKNWNATASSAELGLAFDDSISDLWYMSSVAKSAQNAPKYQIFPLIEKALDCEFWVDYNKETARILYADVLCSTRKFEQALEVLDGDHFLYSADAEFIRSKIFYNLGTDTFLEKARNKIDSARRIYPDDLRFPKLFFEHEYALGGRNEKNAKLADSFINLLYKNPSLSAELEIYLAVFSTGENKIRRLKSFNAKNQRSPLYLIASLEEGIELLPEEKALDYFYSFADKEIDFALLQEFASALKKEESRQELGEYLNQYSGTIYKDTDGDLDFNLKIEYSRGRPQKIIYDENQDEMPDWSASCDFGEPVKLQIPEKSIEIEYGNWPAVVSAIYKCEDKTEYSFFLVPQTLFWTPFSIGADENIKKLTGTDFFIPSVLEKVENISVQKLIDSSSNCSVPCSERENAVVVFNLLDGKPVFARYYENQKMYAQMQFKDGLPESRTVDMDNDGFFELTETYGTEIQNIKKTGLEYEPNFLTKALNAPVKMIQIDMNGDTIADYTEEYTGGEGKISLWDLDGDGEWDVRYEKSFAEKDGSLVEKSTFYRPWSKVPVTVTIKNGKPVSIFENEKKLNVIKDSVSEVYWIENAGSKDDAEKILKTFNQNEGKSVYIIVENGSKRMFAVKSGLYIFAQIVLDNPNSTKESSLSEK